MKHWKHYLTLFSFRHAVSAALSVLIAVIISYYFSFTQTFWVFLATFLVSQTTRGTPFRQGIFFLLIIMAGIFFSFILSTNIKHPDIITLTAAGVFIIFGYLSDVNRLETSKIFFLLIFFPIIMLIAMLSPEHTPPLINDRLIDVLIGAAIGMICGKIILPIRLDKEFSKGVVSLLHILITYSQALTDYILEPETNLTKIEKQKNAIEKMLQAQWGIYPEWAYEVGFNPGLRAGYRFFLINIERITEIFFSMDYLIKRYLNNTLLQGLTVYVANTLQKNQELLSILIYFLENNQLKEFQSDFTSDIDELEKALQRFLPANLELLDISPDYVALTAFVRDLRDLRGLLLQLVMALPKQK